VTQSVAINKKKTKLSTDSLVLLYLKGDIENNNMLTVFTRVAKEANYFLKIPVEILEINKLKLILK
jgi:predicted transcriptional regulator